MRRVPAETVVVDLVVVALSRRLRRLQIGAVVRVALATRSGAGTGQDSARTIAARSGTQEIGAIAQRIGTHAFNRQGKRGRTKHLIITMHGKGISRFADFDFRFSIIEFSVFHFMQDQIGANIGGCCRSWLHTIVECWLCVRGPVDG